MKMPAKQKTRVRVAAARLMLARGMGTTEVIAALRQQFEVSYSSAARTLAVVTRSQEHDMNKTRAAHIASQAAKLNHAQKIAMARQKAITDADGTVKEVPDPDTPSYIRAIAEQSKLLGLNAPEKRELFVHNVNGIVQEITDLVMDYIPSPERQRAFLAALKSRVNAKLSQRPDVIDVALSPSSLSSSSSSSSSSPVQNKKVSKSFKLNENGKNGHAT